MRPIDALFSILFRLLKWRLVPLTTGWKHAGLLRRECTLAWAIAFLCRWGALGRKPVGTPTWITAEDMFAGGLVQATRAAVLHRQMQIAQWLDRRASTHPAESIEDALLQLILRMNVAKALWLEEQSAAFDFDATFTTVLSEEFEAEFEAARCAASDTDVPHFSYNDTVRVKPNAPLEVRPGSLASVVGISAVEDRSGDFLAAFPEGTVYSIEFEDGCSVEVPEIALERGVFPNELAGMPLPSPKEKPILEALSHLAERLGLDALQVVDHWSADRRAIGVASSSDGSRLAYIACSGNDDLRYFVALEQAPGPGSDQPFEHCGEHYDLALDALPAIVAGHLFATRP